VGTARRRPGRWLAVAAITGGLVAAAFGAPAGATGSGYDHNCHCSTTTTAAPTTTTTAPVTTTSVAAVTTIVSSTTVPQTTTTFHQLGTTTVPVSSSTTMPPPGITTMFAPTTTTTPNHNLPFTGGSTGYPFLFGLCCLAAGGLLLFRRHNGSWRASS
jgi:hypothetical protein